jgi:hypothetical protein
LQEDQNFCWNYGLCKHQDQQWLKICQVDCVNLKLIRHEINTKEYQFIYKKKSQKVYGPPVICHKKLVKTKHIYDKE